MTDREMLELAAKAAGIEVTWNERHKCFYFRGDEWWPLEDDGDRYRLARACGLAIDFYGGDVFWNWDGERFTNRRSFAPGDESSEGYAIVRAAAEIGRALG